MDYNLSKGAIQRIQEGEQIEKPILQLLGYKKIGGGQNDRYRFLVSDGLFHHPFAMLATQLNHLIEEGELEKYTVIRLEKYILNNINNNKKIMILLELSVLNKGDEVGDKIGNPQSVTEGGAPTAAVEQAEPSRFPTKQEFPSSNSVNATSMDTGDHDANIHPISSLTPYQNKWTIRARVTSKAPIRRWSNSKGEGHLFSMDLLDESGEIRATAFKEQCDKFYDMIEVDKVFYFTRAQLKPANKQYSSLKNEYEMTFTSETQVTPCNDTSSTPMIQFDFVNLDQLEKIEKDTIIDVIGVCKSTGDVQTILSKNTQKEYRKRDIHLVDRSNKQVTITLWGDEADKFDGSLHPIVALKRVKVSDFGGRSLSVMGSSGIQINPEIREAHILRGWYDREGSVIEMENLSSGSGPGSATSWKTFAEVKEEVNQATEKPFYYTTKATIAMVKKENCLYMACPSSECNKKVIDMNNGSYRCEKCAKEYQSFEWRLILNLNIADFSGDSWVTCFQETAELILQTKASELGDLKESNVEKFNEILNEATFKSFIFKLRSKMEVYNEENRLKTNIMTAIPMEPVDYGKRLIADIGSLSQLVSNY